VRRALACVVAFMVAVREVGRYMDGASVTRMTVIEKLDAVRRVVVLLSLLDTDVRTTAQAVKPPSCCTGIPVSVLECLDYRRRRRALCRFGRRASSCRC
jgi:hypothetical protein